MLNFVLYSTRVQSRIKRRVKRKKKKKREGDTFRVNLSFNIRIMKIRRCLFACTCVSVGELHFANVKFTP